MEIVYARDFGQVPLPSGRTVRVPKGSHWPATDQVVRTAPDLFTSDPRYGLAYTEAPPGYDVDLNELESRVDGDVEEATAVPGERRSVRRRRVEPEETS